MEALQGEKEGLLPLGTGGGEGCRCCAAMWLASPYIANCFYAAIKINRKNARERGCASSPFPPPLLYYNLCPSHPFLCLCIGIILLLSWYALLQYQAVMPYTSDSCSVVLVTAKRHTLLLKAGPVVIDEITTWLHERFPFLLHITILPAVPLAPPYVFG